MPKDDVASSWQRWEELPQFTQFVWGLGRVCLNGHSLCVGLSSGYLSSHSVCAQDWGGDASVDSVCASAELGQAGPLYCLHAAPWPSTLMGWWPLAGLSSVPLPADRFRVPVSALRVCSEDFSRVSSATLRGCGAQLWENRKGFGVPR